jgi:hypothetical protein
MKASEILTLKNYNEQLTLLKKNQSDFNTGNIDDSISFYEGKHAILQDEVLQDEWITEEVMNSEGKIEKKSFCVKKTKLALPFCMATILTWFLIQDVRKMISKKRLTSLCTYGITICA